MVLWVGVNELWIVIKIELNFGFVILLGEVGIGFEFV